MGGRVQAWRRGARVRRPSWYVAARAVALALAILLVVPPLPGAQPPPTGGAQPPVTAGQPADAPVFKPEELEQIVAPIALYPDPLVAQVMMASTYPLEVIQAARFLKANPNLKDAALNEELKKYDWDDAVKSLVSLPQVLDLMNEKLDWMQKLGDAFLAQRKETMDAIQRLRARAQAQGNLKSNEQQKVIVEPAASPPSPAPPAAAGQPAPPVEQQTIIKIEPASPQVVYVPAYNPTVVYGAWPYPAYPPYYPYPVGYPWGAAAVSFGVGMAVGAAVWGGCNWGGGDVDVDVNKSNNFSNNVNRSDRATQIKNERGSGQGGRQSWNHNPEHRKGAQYRDSASQQRYNRGSSPQAGARDSYRGRADQGGRGGADQGGRGGAGQGGGGAARASAGGVGSGGGGQRGGAFEGMGQGRSQGAYSQRGQASVGSSRASGFSGGGGGSRAGGGGGGGGGRSGGGGGGGRGGGRR